MDESDNRHLDAAAEEWKQEETRARRWTLMLRVLPYVVIGVLLLAVFRIFS